MIPFIVKTTIFLMSLLATLAVIFIDVYRMPKISNKEQINIDMVKFDRCILPYRNNL